MATLIKGGSSTDEPKKLMVLDFGEPGVGKSTFAATFPPPHYVYNIDRPWDDIIKRLPKHYDVYYESVTMDVDGMSQGVAARYLLKFDELMRQALTGKKGSFIIDGWDIFWDIVKIAKLPTGDQDSYAREYADANSYMNNHLRRLGVSPLNVCFTTLASSIWKGATQETKLMKPDGFKHKGRWLTHEVYLFTPERRFEAPRDPTQEATGQSHSAYIGVSKLNESLIGRVIPNLTFKSLWRYTFGSVYPEADLLWNPFAERS